MKTCAVVLNGINPPKQIDAEFIICADGGFSLLRERKADVIIGDFDSLQYIPKDIKTIRFEKDKDMTDGELCLQYAKQSGFVFAKIYCALGGRIDHVFANLNLLGFAKSLQLDAQICDDDFTVVLATQYEFDAPVGTLFSILPKTDLKGLKISGAKFELKNTDVNRYSALGISNIAASEHVKISAKSGEFFLFIFH